MAEQELGRFTTRFAAETDRASISRTRAFFGSLRAGLNRLGVQATITGGILTAATTGFVKQFGNLETQFAKIEGLVGIARDTIDKRFAPAVRNLSADLGIVPEKLAEGLFFITSAGQRGAQAIETLTISAKAQVAQLGETNIVADLLTSAINAYGSANLTAADAADQLAMGVRLGKLEAASLAPVMGALLPLSSKLGVSFREVVGLMAAQSRTGTDAATGATQLNSVFTDLVKTSEQGEKAIREKLGMSMAELRDQIGERGLLPVLQMLDQAFGSNVEELALVFDNVRALRSVLDLLGENVGTTVEIMDGMEDSLGALDEAYEAQTKTINFQFNRAQAAAKLAMIALGAAMAPVVGQLLDRLIPALHDAIEAFENLPPHVQSMVGWLALLGPVLLVLGAALPAIGFALEGAAVAIGALTSPVVLLIALLAGLAYGAYALWGPQISAAWESVKTTYADPILAEIKRQFSGPSWETLKAAWEGRTLAPVIAEVFPELDESEQTWGNIGRALFDRIVAIAKFATVVIFPELDGSDITWGNIGTTIADRIAGLGTLLVVLLLPEVDTSDITWNAVGAALFDRVLGLGAAAIVLLLPSLDETELTWTAVGSALSARVLSLSSAGIVWLLPELNETDLTWNAVGAALFARVLGLGEAAVVLLLPSLDETDITWNSVGAALLSRIVALGEAAIVLLLPELDETDLAWNSVGMALFNRVLALGEAAIVLLLPSLDETDLTWNSVREAINARLIGLSDSLIALIVPRLGLTDEAAAALQEQWSTWASSFLTFRVNVGFAALEGFTTFWSSFIEGAREAGGAEAVQNLVGAVVNLLTSMIDLGSQAANLALGAVFAPVMQLIREVGGYEGTNGEVLMQFLDDVGGWSGSEAVTAINNLATALNGLGDAIAWFTENAGKITGKAAELIDKYGPDIMTTEEMLAATPTVEKKGGGLGNAIGNLFSNTPSVDEIAAMSSGAGAGAGGGAATEQKKPWWQRAWNYVVNSDGLPEGHEGGITGGTREFLAMLNPGEVIAPLDQLDQVIGSVLGVPSLAQAATGGGGNQYNFEANLTVQVPAGDEAKGRRLLDYGSSRMRQQFRDLVDDLDRDDVR